MTCKNLYANFNETLCPKLEREHIRIFSYIMHKYEGIAIPLIPPIYRNVAIALIDFSNEI